MVSGSLALFLSFALLYRDVVWWLVDDWDPNGDYSHGFFMVPLALYFAWEQRAALKSAVRRPDGRAVFGLIASMLLLLAGTVAAETFLARVSMVGAVTAVIWFLYGS